MLSGGSAGRGRARDEMSHTGVGCRGPPALLPARSASCHRASVPRSACSRAALRRLDLHAFGGRRAALLLRSRRRSCTALARQGPIALLNVTEDTFEAEVLQVGAGFLLLLSWAVWQQSNAPRAPRLRPDLYLCLAGLSGRDGPGEQEHALSTVLRQHVLVLCLADLGCCLRRQTGQCW